MAHLPSNSQSEPGNTRVAVLGTLTEFTSDPLPFDAQALVKLVLDIQPDLLCLDLTPDEWQRRDFGGLPQEYRQALLPLADASDLVVAPVGTGSQPESQTPAGWRGWLTRVARRGLALLQRSAPGPAALNAGWRHELANWLYDLIVSLAGKGAADFRESHMHSLAGNILSAARNDPGAHILVVVNLQYCHHLRPMLREQPGIEVVPFDQLSIH